MPLGGIGSGCIALAGNGRIVDWEIFNRPNKNSLNGMTHFAVKCEQGGKLIDARILQGDLLTDFIGEENSTTLFKGFGWGASRNNLCGMPHFREHKFKSAYPYGEILYGEQVKTSLINTYKNNYCEHARDIANPWRIYALNDEPVTQICTFPTDIKRPKIPLPYAQEDQGGYTYAFAIHLIMVGYIKEGEKIINGLRSKYTGENRNPFNEIECSSNYARSMATYSLLIAYSGFSFDISKNFIGFSPITKGDFKCFWSLGKVWGNVEFTSKMIKINILNGELALKTLKCEKSNAIVE